MEKRTLFNFEDLQQMKILEVEKMCIPMYGNKHTFVYGKVRIVGIRGKAITIPFECNKVINGYVAEDVGESYWTPKIVIYKV